MTFFYLLIIWLVCFPLDIYSLYLTPSCQDGCINTQIASFARIISSIALILITFCNVSCGRMICYVLQLNETNLLKDRLNLSDDLLSVEERRRYLSHQTVATSTHQQSVATTTSTTAEINPIKEQINRMASFTGIESGSDSNLLPRNLTTTTQGSASFTRSISNQLARFRSFTNDSNSNGNSNRNNNHTNTLEGDHICFNRAFSNPSHRTISTDSTRIINQLTNNHNHHHHQQQQHLQSHSVSDTTSSNDLLEQHKSSQYQTDHPETNVKISNSNNNNNNNKRNAMTINDMIIQQQSNKISLFIRLSTICSIIIVINNLIWCLRHINNSNSIYFLSPPCYYITSFIFDINYWIYGIWFFIFYYILPSRQQSDNNIVKILLQRINAFMIHKAQI